MNTRIRSILNASGHCDAGCSARKAPVGIPVSLKNLPGDAELAADSD
jgi:hypothetical protein